MKSIEMLEGLLPRNSDLAELVGIILGDGSFYITDNFYQMDIAFNSNDIHYINFVRKLLQKIVGGKIYEKKEKNANAKHLRISSKDIVLKLLNSTIRKAGNKIKNKVSIPTWIFENEKFLKVCLRGLIDTDGSIYRLKPQYPHLFQLSFKNFNKVLLEDCRKGFLKLGYTPSKIFTHRFVITRQNEIKKYFKEIGTNNPKENSPFV